MPFSDKARPQAPKKVEEPEATEEAAKEATA